MLVLGRVPGQHALTNQFVIAYLTGNATDNIRSEVDGVENLEILRGDQVTRGPHSGRVRCLVQ